MKTTTNLGLKKPEGTDIVNIDDINYNADIMDAEIGNIKKGVVKVGVSASSDTAAKLQTPRAISLNGDVIGNANFDGSANTCINARLQNSGVTAGSYTKVSVDEKGRVVTGSNPMTLAGYGITDALPASSYTAADVLNKLKTVHGEGSGLNADLLDGKHSNAFATAAQGVKADTALQTSQLDKPGGVTSYDVFKSHLADIVTTPQANKILKLDNNAKFPISIIATTQDITFYVDATNGSDTTGDGTNSKPFKTIMKAINTLPQIINHKIEINISEGTYNANEDIQLNGYLGKGSIHISGKSVFNVFSSQSIKISNCGIKIIVSGITFIIDGICIEIFRNNGGKVEVIYDNFKKNGTSPWTAAISAWDFGGKVKILGCGFENYDFACIDSKDLSEIDISDITINNVTGKTVIVEQRGAAIIQTSTVKGITLAQNGGVIRTW